MYQKASYCLRNRENVSLRIMGLNEEVGRVAGLQKTLRRPHPGCKAIVKTNDVATLWILWTHKLMDSAWPKVPLLEYEGCFFMHDAMSSHFP